jgi:hypothetical protein
MSQEALKLAEKFEDQAKFIYELVLESDDHTSAVAKEIMALQISMAKEHEEHAKIIRKLIAENEQLREGN